MSGEDPWKDYPTAVLREDLAPRLAPAARAVRNLLLDEEWHTRDELTEVAHSASDLMAGTVANMLSRLRRDGAIVGKQVAVKGQKRGISFYRLNRWE